MTSLSDQALQILHEWVHSESLRRHCYAVADCMQHFAQLNGADADLWQAVGLLHDMDYERYPNAAQSATEEHPSVAAQWLSENGWSGEICRAILSHANYSGVARETPLEKTCMRSMNSADLSPRWRECGLPKVFWKSMSPPSKRR